MAQAKEPSKTQKVSEGFSFSYPAFWWKPQVESLAGGSAVIGNLWAGRWGAGMLCKQLAVGSIPTRSTMRPWCSGLLCSLRCQRRGPRSFLGGRSNLRVGSGERVRLISARDRPDRLKRVGSIPTARTKLCGEDWYPAGSHKPCRSGSIPLAATNAALAVMVHARG